MENNYQLYYTGAFDQSISIPCSVLQDNFNLDQLVLNVLRQEVGNKCIKHGYINKDSIKINKRSIGTINSSRFDGSLRFDISYTADVCNPVIGQVFKCQVKSKNKMGILAHLHPLVVVVTDQSKDASHTQKMKNIDIGDEIEIELVGTRFDLYDNNITAIGNIIS